MSSSAHNMSVSNTRRQPRAAASAARGKIQSVFVSTRSGPGKGMKMNTTSSRRTVKKGFTSQKHKLISRARRAEEIRARRTQRTAYIRHMLRGKRRTQKVRNAKEEKKRLAEAREAALGASAAAAASAAPLGNSHMSSFSARPFHANFNSLSNAAAAIRLPRSSRAARAAYSPRTMKRIAEGESLSNDE